MQDWKGKNMESHYLLKIRHNNTWNEILMQHLSILYTDFEQPVSNMNIG